MPATSIFGPAELEAGAVGRSEGVTVGSGEGTAISATIDHIVPATSVFFGNVKCLTERGR